MVRTVVEAALVDGEIIRPWLGARLQPVTQDLASSLGLDRPRGAIVADLWEGGAADRAGLEQGDVVIAVDGVEVNDEIGARFRFATRMIGDRAALTVLRDGRERVLTVEAEPAPGAVEGARMDISGENPLAGAELVQLSPAFNEESGIDPFMDGVLVSGVTRRSAAAYFGFRPGDRILSINEERIDTLIDLNRILRELEGEKTWPIEIERQGERFSRTLSL
jgi:S1-C subfamily serine protease